MWLAPVWPYPLRRWSPRLLLRLLAGRPLAQIAAWDQVTRRIPATATLQLPATARLRRPVRLVAQTIRPLIRIIHLRRAIPEQTATLEQTGTWARVLPLRPRGIRALMAALLLAKCVEESAGAS